MNGIYHICTDGLSSNILFKNETDFIAGMNGIPLCSIATGTSVLCFCLMSNHVHFVIIGNEKNHCDVTTNQRAMILLKQRCEEAKKVLSVAYDNINILSEALRNVCICHSENGSIELG